MSEQTSRAAALVVLALAMIAAPAFIYPVFVMNAMVMALLAASFNLVFGYTGLLSFGHAAFYGIGSYGAAVLLKDSGWPMPLAMVGAVVAAMVAGFVIGGLAIRRRGIYFAMITLALAEIVHFGIVQWPAAGGENGLQGVPRGSLLWLDLGSSTTLYYVVLVVITAALALTYRIIHSPFGRILHAIRDNEPRAVSLGYSVDRYLLLAMVLSAGLAGLAGALKTLIFQFATLNDVHWGTSGLAVLACLIGGTGTFWGPIIGGVILSLLYSLLAESGEWVSLILGIIFVVCVHLFRDGIVGRARAAAGRLKAATKFTA
ncbi:branched-chain amino acid ABC transporter permease [Enterovirga sp.]|uniref:branched-chain amino acid ABC transporter permease n=1 Tax=Enterovirga sp. TaxID=2026350 RepID=UPI00261EBF99|nr:branched-chain amino acid ABC transporter permease [Enterovirga sp.]MDB5592027.1 putative type branched chain amino acid transport system, permease component [Enterovirga sp.]